MKVTVLTATKNSGKTIEDSLRSVRDQSYPNIEHLVIDGFSTDETVRIVGKYERPGLRMLQGKDRSMYDAINKGIAAVTGEIVAVLNSDDVYADKDVIRDVVTMFERSGADSVYGDIVYVRQNDLGRVVRYWKSGEGRRRDIEWGWMPPHPAFFVKKNIYDKFGLYDIQYRIAADYEMMLRLLYTQKISSVYLHRLCTRMRVGGMSNAGVRAMIRKSSEDLRVCQERGLPCPLATVMSKNFRKLTQFVERASEALRI